MQNYTEKQLFKKSLYKSDENYTVNGNVIGSQFSFFYEINYTFSSDVKKELFTCRFAERQSNLNLILTNLHSNFKIFLRSD